MNFSVDRDFVRVGDKSYAINKINSVEVRSQKKKGSTAYLALWTIAAGAVLMGIKGGATAAMGWAPVAFFCALIGHGSYGRRFPTMSYALYLVTSSSEAAAVTTTDRSEIDNVRREIEEAIAARAHMSVRFPPSSGPSAQKDGRHKSDLRAAQARVLIAADQDLTASSGS